MAKEATGAMGELPGSHQDNEAPGQQAWALEDSLGFSLGRAHRLLREAWERQIAELGLSAPQSAALRAICEQPGAGLRALARYLRTDPMNAKRLADHLEARALVRSSSGPSHRQRRELGPTEAGRSLAHEVARRASAWELHLVDLLGQADLRQLRRLLKKLESALSAAAPPAQSPPAQSPPARRPGGERRP